MGRNRLKKIILLAVLCIPCSSLFAQTKVGKVDNVVGSVTIVHEEGHKKVTAKTGDPLYLKDLVETKKESSVQLSFLDGTAVVLRDNTKVAVNEFLFDPAKKQRNTVFDVMAGKMKAVVSKTFNKKTSKTEFKTPTATVGVRGTELALDVTKKKTTVYCLKGIVATLNPLMPFKEIMIGANQYNDVERGQAPSSPLPIPKQVLDQIENQFGFPTSVESLKRRGMDQLRSKLPFP